MKTQLVLLVIFPALIQCQQSPPDAHSIFMPSISGGEGIINPYQRIRDIPTPPGFSRKKVNENSFDYWLKSINLKKNSTVFLYNHQPKANQQAQFAVLAISVGNQDLQQCADAVMRLKAEYLYNQNRLVEIRFSDNNNKIYSAATVNNRRDFEQYLKRVFSFCGTASLEKQLLKVIDLQQIQPGDVLIQGGYPGHAMIIVDMAENRQGKKIFLLAQSYMPAQDIHIVKNPGNSDLHPWYEIHENQKIMTPEWIFTSKNLRKWP